MGRDTYRIMVRASDRRVLIGAASLAQNRLDCSIKLSFFTLGAEARNRTPASIGRGKIPVVVGKKEPQRKGKPMDKEQTVSEMANEVPTRQAEARTERTGEPLEEALEAVLKTEAGSQLRDLRNGTHRAERAYEWQEGIAWERAQERPDALG
jgi:hypothetical protein